MSAITKFIEAARSDRPVYICDVRDAFQREGTRPFHFHVTLYDDSVRRFALKAPHCRDGEESAFVASFLSAMLYNALSSLGAKRIDIYIDLKDAPLAGWASKLDEIFQVDAPLATRSGYGKCLNVNQRTLGALCGPEARFAFRLFDIADEPVIYEARPACGSAPVFAVLPERAKHGMFMGMDIGGTDVKVVAALDGNLVAFKEYDWNPAACALAEQLIDPLCLLTRLMRAAVCMEASGMRDRAPAQVFEKSATDGKMAAAVCEMEALLGDRLRGFDGIGLCFPDVVIRNRIIGGETNKTYDMRMNSDVDYEAQFAKLTNLCDILKAYATPEGVVMNTNDGPMAAFTTAVEQAAAGADLSDGFSPTPWAPSWAPAGSCRTARFQRFRWRSITSSSTWAASGSAAFLPKTSGALTTSIQAFPARCRNTPVNPACSAWQRRSCPEPTRRRIRGPLTGGCL